MGAIWDFISGKSTDWDEFDRKKAAAAERAREYRASHPIKRKKRYVAYCKICGEKTLPGDDINCPDPATAVRHLQMMRTSSSSCGQGNHIPEVYEV